ncbi:hypothetical protein JZ751_004608 [Albula glossodonta]|uniref:Uncharacterized protein n=1 Tax=Albula glossodonta TaxID=121402 RepID=A0A8T2N4Y9_9TELE|nr:hypothetical protein JZ751_004608 [Albula glossodonta]
MWRVGSVYQHKHGLGHEPTLLYEVQCTATHEPGAPQGRRYPPRRSRHEALQPQRPAQRLQQGQPAESRIRPLLLQLLPEVQYLCHVYVRNDSLGAVVIADNEYPSRVCFTLLDKVDSIDWPSGSPATIQYTALDSYLAKYQNPREADAMTKVQAELDETKIILHNTMESLLERGEKLDDLVQKSEHLGSQSKAFYKTHTTWALGGHLASH